MAFFSTKVGSIALIIVGASACGVANEGVTEDGSNESAVESETDEQVGSGELNVDPADETIRSSISLCVRMVGHFNSAVTQSADNRALCLSAIEALETYCLPPETSQFFGDVMRSQYNDLVELQVQQRQACSLLHEIEVGLRNTLQARVLEQGALITREPLGSSSSPAAGLCGPSDTGIDPEPCQSPPVPSPSPQSALDVTDSIQASSAASLYPLYCMIDPSPSPSDLNGGDGEANSEEETDEEDNESLMVQCESGNEAPSPKRRRTGGRTEQAKKPSDPAAKWVCDVQVQSVEDDGAAGTRRPCGKTYGRSSNRSIRLHFEECVRANDPVAARLEDAAFYKYIAMKQNAGELTSARRKPRQPRRDPAEVSVQK